MTRVVRDLLILAGVAVGSTVILWITTGMKVVYQNFDGPYYTAVAKCFYNKDCLGKSFDFPLKLEYYPAHFPLYPTFIKLMEPLGLIRAGLIINILATVAAAIVIYEVTKRNLWIAMTWLFFWPRMWVVRSIASPETLFILFVVLSLYLFEKKSYWMSALAGSAAVLTKSPGVLLFAVYALMFARKPDSKIWPVLLIPITLLGLFYFFKVQTGDFFAYFHSGDNIHLQYLPFKVFDSGQPWVGTFWLEDVLWIYLIGAIGVIKTMRKNQVWGYFGVVFYATILFVSHRDIARYSLPLVPVVLIGLSEIFERREVRWAMALLVVPMFFYSVNFLLHNQLSIADWAPFL